MTIGELAAGGLVAAPPEPAKAEAPAVAEEATVRLSSSSAAVARRDGAAGPSRARVVVAVAASVALLAAAAGTWFATRPVASQRPRLAGAPGTVVLNASPWGKVVSVVEETSGAVFEAGPAVTPCRISLPAGRWRLVVRGADGAEATVTAVVPEGGESAVHVDLPGFDVESAVRSFVPDGA